MQKCKVNELVKLERTHKINKTNNKHTYISSLCLSEQKTIKCLFYYTFNTIFIININIKLSARLFVSLFYEPNLVSQQSLFLPFSCARRATQQHDPRM